MTEMTLEKMTIADVDEAVELVRLAMNADEADWARESMGFHFGCAGHGLDDGRVYYLAKVEDRIVGLVGLHRYIWGPPENVWLGWFAVAPDCRRAGIGRRLMQQVETLARQQGYKKLFVETYDHPTFTQARAFYASVGFSHVGNIENYLPDGSTMLVFCKKTT